MTVKIWDTGLQQDPGLNLNLKPLKEVKRKAHARFAFRRQLIQKYCQTHHWMGSSINLIARARSSKKSIDYQVLGFCL